MTTHSSSIDDVLATSHLPHEESAPVELGAPETPEIQVDDAPNYEPEETEQKTPDSETEIDDYGNEKLKQESKMYTEDEVNERINKAVRERLARLERNNTAQQPTAQQQEQAAQAGFEYDENSNLDWQQQLKQFIRQTTAEIQQETVQKQHQEKEQALQAEFEEKFHAGMSKFQDFRDVVGSQPITDAMTVATRAMKDPAAFLYAASKRHGNELQRIASLPDPYTQMVEMGRLEERMRKAKDVSKAPRPLGQTREDANVKTPSSKEPSIEDLIMMNDARRIKNMRSRRG